MATKANSTHWARKAYVYARSGQSTPGQVIEHRESTERQYHLHQRALELGWPADRVEVIDEDQGRSGTSAAHRTGFQRLVADVGLGQVGLVLMLEASRLARNNSDWYRLIEICGIGGTLTRICSAVGAGVADENAVYDPREPNDRLLLGVKGTLSEAEMFTLRTRLYEGRWNKARKGQLLFPLPVGYLRGPDGAWQLDPDVQVRERLAYLFQSFRRHGNLRAVVRELREQQLDLPSRSCAREDYGALQWKVPTLSAVVRILHNPAYAGAYVYGRQEYVSTQRSAKTGRATAHPRPVAQWPVTLQQHHPAYLDWETFEKNQERLQQNFSRPSQPGVARQGRALLQGIVYCARCGHKLNVQHRAGREKRSPCYVCQHGYRDGDDQICQSMASRGVDAAVVQAFLQAVSPAQLHIAAQVADRVEQELQAQRRQRELQVAQARYDARLAQRQYDQVDPDNRLVALELERRWNEKLARVAQLEQTFAQAQRDAHWTLTSAERNAIIDLAEDLPATLAPRAGRVRVWQAETTTCQERKQLLRMVIESVQLDGARNRGSIEIQIHWRTGVITALTIPRARPGEGSLKTPPQAVARIHELAGQFTYAQIAEQLNREGLHSAFGRPFSALHVGYICRRDGQARGTPHSSHHRRDKAAECGTRGAL